MPARMHAMQCKAESFFCVCVVRDTHPHPAAGFGKFLPCNAARTYFPHRAADPCDVRKLTLHAGGAKLLGSMSLLLAVACPFRPETGRMGG